MIEKNNDREKYIRDLDWNNEFSVQKSGIQYALEMVNKGHLEVKDLIQSSLGKQYWENSARVLLELPSDFIFGYEGLLFDAIQDINWPGTELLIELLSRQPISRIIQLYKNAFEQAKLERDESWIFNLYLLGGKLNTQCPMDETLDEMRLILNPV